MSMCNCDTSVSPQDSTIHTNAFVELNGMPYLLAEYLDRNNFQQIDLGLIRSEIHVDTTEAMRAIIDIGIDDIGKVASTGLPNIIGNTTKTKSIVNNVKMNHARMDFQFPVLRRGLILRVNYQIENSRTGQVLRTMVEDMRIDDRNYFIYINRDNINDNAIIVNFSKTLVSTINQFTHGTDPMVLRITSIQMCYECVRINPLKPRITQSIMPNPQGMGAALPSYGTEAEMYYYHKNAQNKQVLGDPIDYHRNVVPDQWYNFNTFYHFQNEGRDIILHNNEITDINMKSILLACGTVQVNRSFIINPGHRIIFKFSVWKNDLAVVNDTKEICDAMHAQYDAPFMPLNPGPDPNSVHIHDHERRPIYPDLDEFMRLYKHSEHTDYEQNAAINRISVTLNELNKAIKTLNGEDPDTVEDPDLLPEGPSDNMHPHHHHCHGKAEKLNQLSAMLSALQDQVSVLASAQAVDDSKPNISLMSDEDIADAINTAAMLTR